MEEELWFECCKRFACECSYMGHSGHPQRTKPFNYKVDVKPDLVKLLRHCHDPQKMEWNWQHILEHYTKRVSNLTYPSDVFPALQGLAKMVPPLAGAYLAGHWEAWLDRSLSWFVFGQRGPRLVEWRAPRWSWVSVNSGVAWTTTPGRKQDPKNSFVTVVRSNTVSKGQDHTGQLIAGEIVLKGCCLNGKIAYDDQHDDARHDTPSILFENQSVQLNTRFEGGSNWAFWDHQIEQFRPHAVADGSTILAMKLVQDMDEEPEYMRRNSLFWTCLILRLLEEEDCVYERIGLLMPDSCRIEQTGDSLDALHQRDAKEMENTIR